MSTLNELVARIVDAVEGESSAADIEAQLNEIASLQGDLAQKAKSIAHVARGMEAKIEEYKNFAKLANERAKVLANEHERFINNVKMSMHMLEIKEFGDVGSRIKLYFPPLASTQNSHMYRPVWRA